MQESHARAPRRAFLASILSIAAMLLGAAPETTRPNLILIVADDLGYGDLGVYGGERSRTSHLDRLASEGLRFTDFHSNGVVCSPTRASLMTGRYPRRAGISRLVLHNDLHSGMQLSQVTFAEMLQKAGYRTALFGKWHLGNGPEFNPVLQGFEEFIGFATGNIDYRSHLGVGLELDWWKQREVKDEPGYVTHLLTEHALDFLVRNQDGPFCMVLSHQAPHSPSQGPYDPAQRAPVDLNEEEQVTFLAAINAGIPEPPPRYRGGDAYREMVESLDAGVGRLMATLNKLGLRERTLVLFVSDNGPTRFMGSPGPFRGRKGLGWEGGHRVPAIASWPGKIEPGLTGHLGMTMDVFPTFLSLAGVEVPSGLVIDGVDLSPVLFGEGAPPERTVFWSYRDMNMPRHKVARRGAWKLLAAGPRKRLFNLGRDPAEKKDVAKEHPEIRDDLFAQLKLWDAELAAITSSTPKKTRARPKGK